MMYPRHRLIGSVCAPRPYFSNGANNLQFRHNMLVWGTCQPTGETNAYEGLFYTQRDIDECVNSDEMVGKPVKIEHLGGNIGKVVSAWKNGSGQIDCLLDIDNSSIEGGFATQFLQTGVCKELSLGYVVDMQQTVQNNKDGVRLGATKAVKKKIVEVSIVKKGARDSCFIHSVI